jgi:hypothetical protein
MGGGPFALLLDGVDGATILLSKPTDGSQPRIDGFLQIPANAPGVYSSTDANAAGDLTFSYELPIPPGVDCSTSGPPACPPGCGTICAGGGPGGETSSTVSGASGGSGNGSSSPASSTGMSSTTESIIGGCEPCTPINPMVTFQAAAGLYGNSGSWTLTLSAGGPHPHGKLDATLVGSDVTNTGDAGPNPGPASMSVEF